MAINTRPTHQRTLSVFQLVMINVIAIDSLRSLASNAKMGLTLIFFYLLGSLFFLLPCLLATAELATHRPKAGGAYIWIKEAFGLRIGFFAVWLQWIYNVFWYPTILSFLAMNLAYLIHPDLIESKTFLFLSILSMFSLGTFVNCFGMGISGLVSTVSAILGTLVPMFCLMGLGLFWVIKGQPMAITPTIESMLPNFAHNQNLAFFVLILFSLVGIEMSAVHAEDVKDPARHFPKALFYSFVLIVFTLLFSSLAIVMIVPPAILDIISGINQALILVLKAFHLEFLLPLVIVFILMGGFGGMAAWIIGPPKALVIAAEDIRAPKWLVYRNRHGVPVGILGIQWLIVAILSSAFLWFDSIHTWYWILSDLTAQLALMFYICLFSALIRLRYQQNTSIKAFRIPGGLPGVWAVGLIGIITCLIAIGIGFIPPESIPIPNIYYYLLALVSGLVLFSLPPLFLIGMKNQH